MKAKPAGTRDYTTGRAARELRVSPVHVRALCQAGMIAVRSTPGGHFRIPKSEVARLRHEGVPEPPPATPAESSQVGNAVTPAGNTVHRHPVLLAEPSKGTIAAADEVVRLENEVKAIDLKRSKEESLDWFRQREQVQMAKKVARRQRAEEAEAQRERHEWEDGWLAYALSSVPKDAPRQVELDIRAAVGDALAQLDPDQPRDFVARLVLAAVDKGLAPWRRRKEIEGVIEEASEELPVCARTLSKFFPPTEWQIRSRQAARDAISRLSNEASLEEIRCTAMQAGRQVGKEYEHRQACERVVFGVFLTHGTTADNQAAKEAVRKALETLPIGSSQADTVKVRDAALAPFKAAAQAAFDADRYLLHVHDYIARLDTLEPGHLDGLFERQRFAEQVAKEIRAVLFERLRQGPLDEHDARQLIEEFVDAKLDEKE